jgi:type I restriction enzyme S subunit
MTVPPINVSPEEWKIVADILHKHVPDREVWAFGSRAKRTNWTNSDLDLAIITDAPLSWDVRGDLTEDLSESDLPFRVDILDWATTRENFRDLITADKVIVQQGTCAARPMEPPS